MELVGVRQQLSHSVSDWDFQTTNWALSNAHFVSPPTSLHGTGDILYAILCRKPKSLLLPEGRFVFSLYCSGAVTSTIIFRNQAPLGTANLYNNYEVRVHPVAWAYFLVRVDGYPEQIGTWLVHSLTGQWAEFRLTWWNGVDLQNNPALATELERKEDGVWVSYGIVYDPDNRWKDSAINRVGVGNLNPYNWFDDTEIWIPL